MAFGQRSGVTPFPGEHPSYETQKQSQYRLFNTPTVRQPQNTTANEPLFLELAGPIAGTHWVINYVCAFGQFLTRQPTAGVQSPVIALYLQPDQGDDPIESSSDAAGAGWNFRARAGALIIPSTLKVSPLVVGGFAFECQGLLALPLVVPGGFNIRFIANCQPGTGTPGPGALSFGQIVAQGYAERDVSPA